MKKRNDQAQSSSEDDENAELLTEDIEQTFLNVISRLKKKDPKLYDKGESFFSLDGSGLNKSMQSNQSKRNSKMKSQKCKTKVTEESTSADEFWTSTNLSKEDKFLRDYILNKKFLEQDEDFDLKKELEKLTEEEEEVEEQTMFEEKYNCRFENFDEDFLRKYPQTFKRTQQEKHKNNQFPNKEINVSEIDKLGETSAKQKRKHNINSENKDSESSTKKMKKEQFPKMQAKQKKRKRKLKNIKKTYNSIPKVKGIDKTENNKFSSKLEKKPRKLRHRALFRKSSVTKGTIPKLNLSKG